MPSNEGRRKAAETKRNRTLASIMEAAIKLYVGGARFTHERVAEEAGVSVATVYRYFPSAGELEHEVFTTLRASRARKGMVELGIKALVAQMERDYPGMLDEWRMTVLDGLDEGDVTREWLSHTVTRALLVLE